MMNRRDFTNAGIAFVAFTALPKLGVAQSTPEASEEPLNLYLFGNAHDLILEGEPGVVSVVLIGAPIDYDVPIVIRNNSDETAFLDGITGIARGADGRLIGVVEDDQIAPYRIEAGELAIGIVSFGRDVMLPPDAAYELNVNLREATARHSLANLQVVEAELTATGLLGVVENNSGVPVRFPRVTVLWFDEAGATTGGYRGYVVEDEIAAGGIGTFNAEFYGAYMTERYLVSVVGRA